MKTLFLLLELGAGVVIAVGSAAWTHAEESKSASQPSVDSVVALLGLVLDADEQTARDCLRIVTRAVQNGEVAGERLSALRDQLGERLSAILADNANPLRLDAALLAVAWKDAGAIRIARATLKDPDSRSESRLAALQALIAANDRAVLEDAQSILADRESNSSDFRAQVLGALGRLDSPDVAAFVLMQYDQFEPSLRPRVVELLTQRPEWTAPLLAAIADKQISKDALNLNQLRRIASFNDPELEQRFTAIYGAIRDGRNPARERMVRKMADFLRGTPGNPHRGVAVFKKVCAQCHKIYGEGAEVGPDITRNGRNNWQQLLSNVFDPSLVIGPGYQARQLLTADGRVLTGLPVEESEQRVVLKVQGGKIETIARADIDEYVVSEVSMMPEELEKQLKQQEIADLMSYLALDKPPDDPDAKYLPGAPAPKQQR